MTTYSVLGAGDRVAVVATWPGTSCDHSTKVTTVADATLARDLAFALTVVSEAAWNAAAWLDTWAPTRQMLTALIEWARQPTLLTPCPELGLAAYRHADVFSSLDSLEHFNFSLPWALERLTHTQRLAVADDLAADLAAMDLALADFPEREPVDNSRAWQFATVTSQMKYGLDAYLPDGAAGWAAVAFEAVAMTELWPARGHLLRVEQLIAACRATGGRAYDAMDATDIEAHCVWGEDLETRVVKVTPGRPGRRGLRYHGMTPMTVRESVGMEQYRVLGEVDPYDTNGFVRLAGDWVLAVPFRG